MTATLRLTTRAMAVSAVATRIQMYSVWTNNVCSSAEGITSEDCKSWERTQSELPTLLAQFSKIQPSVDYIEIHVHVLET